MLLNYPKLTDYSKGTKTTKNYCVSNPMLYSSAVSKLICEKTLVGAIDGYNRTSGK
jgi:hypothetical protein